MISRAISLCSSLFLVPVLLLGGTVAGWSAPVQAQLAAVSEPQDQQVARSDDPEPDWSLLGGGFPGISAKAATLTKPSKPAAAPDTTAWTSHDNDDGSTALSVTRPLVPFWDARVGADMTVSQQTTPQTLDALLQSRIATGITPASSGTAWAALTAPGLGSIWDKTVLEARLDPLQDQSTMSTSISKSLSLAPQVYSLNLQGSYNIVEQRVLPGLGIAGGAVRDIQIGQTAQLNLARTDTSLIASRSFSSADDRWLNSIGIAQKLDHGFSVTGSIGESAEGRASASLSAGYNHSW